ncbi:molybdenum cofactor guanylyltransferase [Dermacoccus abyssi]|uniref:molybdenum cofactor guanylyltransferase n=1 Tax=Dermacoccus abyssi TaxID=322596 RepID=UPI002AD2FC3C|nr:NTP transferase domain-containing protein [Dermacoccus abyssi]
MDTAAGQAGTSFDAVVLVGGRGSRLGGVDKAALDLGGHPLVDASLNAARGARTLVVVGRTSAPLPSRAVLTQEEPAGSGPAAGFARGLTSITDPASWTLLLGCDVPGAGDAVRRLLNASAAGAVADVDGFVLTDADGRAQWMLGLYRTASVRVAVDASAATNLSMRALFTGLDLVLVRPAGPEWHDIDTWADHAAWTERLDPQRPA